MYWKFFLWGLSYSAICQLAEYIFGCCHVDYKYTSVIIFMFAAVFICWICKNKYRKYIGIKKTHMNLASAKLLLPVLLFPIYNLVTAESFYVNIYDIMLALGVAVTEEVFFRGVFQRYFERGNIKNCVIKTNLIFALYHCVNIFAGKKIQYVIIQIMCAFVLGLCYSMITVLFDSILPVMAAHFMVNITGINMYAGYDWKILTVIAGYIVYTVFLMKKCSRPEVVNRRFGNAALY